LFPIRAEARSVPPWEHIEMTPERWQEVKKLLAVALERKPSERSAVSIRLAWNLPYGVEVESLIAAHEQGQKSYGATSR
jgi:hypothetical protein